MDQYNPNASMLPNVGGSIMAMRGGGAPEGYNPDVSVIQLTPTANHVPIVDMKGGDDTLPMAAAATIVLAPGVAGPATKTPEKPIQIILFGKTFNAFSTTVDAASQPILTLLGTLSDAEKSAALHEIYDGIVNLRTITLEKYPHLKRLLIRMGIDYAKEKKELTEEPIHLEKTEIKLAFSNGKIEVTLVIKCEQLPSCSQKNLPMAAAATVMTQQGGDGERTIKLFGMDYKFPNRPTTINDHEDLLEELEVKDKGDSFKITLLDEIYDGCYTDGSVISNIKCSTFGTLLEELGQKYALKVHDLLRLNITPQKKGDLIKQKKSSNGDLEFTFTFSKFGKQIGEETKKKVKAASEKAASSNGFFTKLIADPVSSNQVSIRGMVNPNNACFCISSIQLLFSIPQIRTIMKAYGKKNCNDAILAEIYEQIDHPITKVNNNGVLCALFHLFEELGENMTLFSKLEVGTVSKENAVPYELLGYIMKNFEIDSKLNNREYHIGGQEDAQVFLTFLFQIFNEIRPLFQFTQKTITDVRVEDESQQDVWIIQDIFSTSNPGTREINGTTESYRVTLTLENNPYLLLRPSDPTADLSGISHTLSIMKNKTDNKQFKLYGMIRRSGPRTSGHYVYDRQDLTSDKHIVYNDTIVTLDNNKIQMTQDDGLNAYLLVYAEVESPVIAPVKASESVAAAASDLASESASVSPVKSVAATSESVSASAATTPAKPIVSPKEPITTQVNTLANKMITDLISGKYTINDLEKIYGGEEACKPLWLEARKSAEIKSVGMDPSSTAWIFVLGICNFYPRGGIPANEEAAEKFFKNAADKGFAPAQDMLGVIYANRNNIAGAISLWQKAASKGYAESQYRLGQVYFLGTNVNRNIQTAREWFSKAAAKGFQDAKTQLKSMTGAGRTLRASKKSPKKRTLRASKKLRQLLNST